MTPEKRKEFLTLVDQYVADYLHADVGRDHLARARHTFEEGEKNYSRVLEATNRGEDTTDLILNTLLPHNDTKHNRERGAWTHYAPVIRKEIRPYFEGSGWQSSDAWPGVARALLEFIQRATGNPTDLEQACRDFSALPNSKGFQSGTLTPILAAINPEKFVLINKPSLSVLNYFAETNFGQSLVEYPKTNAETWRIIHEIGEEMVRAAGDTAAPAWLLYDIFTHWLGLEDYVDKQKDDTEQVPQKTNNIKINAGMTTPIVKEAAVLSSSDAAFSPQAFDLLALLNDQPVKATYLDRKEEFHSQLEQPFKELLTEVASRLPAPMHARLEMEKKTTSRILKNDYGKGGAWSFFWGAFYPKEGKRTESPQLYVSMFKDVIDFGFAIGDYGGEQQNRFISACKQYQELLRNGLAPMLSDGEYAFGRREETTGDEIAKPTFAEWLADPSKHGIQIRRALSRSEILQTSRASLAGDIASVFIELYPLLLLAADEKPQAALEDWLGLVDDDEPDLQPPYTLDECAEETGLSRGRLLRWVNAINRKGQAIIYGPPGTGKTFLAEHLARHIVADGDGVVEILQFHPAYSYEEFMQGIRPQLTANGALDYSIKRGRFLSFCEEAAKHSGMSVLIIDEINRANLARVFGELMYLLEYRNKRVPLAGGGALSIPGNVRIIGTMNTADRSIALVDHALRRRFAFLELRPEYDILEAYHRKHKTEFPADKLVQKLKMLNNKINDPHYEVGISYFLRVDLAECIEDIWRMEIEPYLQEYFFDQPGNAKAFAWEEISNEVTTQ
jgi:5-methylcytosine-specific restriction protein B